MSVPKFYEFLLPLLKLLEDGEKHLVSDLKKQIIGVLNLSKEDLKEYVPSGSQTLF